jgi:adrenodoxin-NADP+ reductase
MKACIIGSGPSGFYTAKYLLKAFSPSILTRVDILERLVTPFGLVRYGVAPDHPEVKNVQNDFTQVMSHEEQDHPGRVRFGGNIHVGQDISLEVLRKIYNIVILAYGADNDRTLGLPLENQLSGIYGAREFVAWYNGHPDITEAKSLEFSKAISKVEDVVIVGNGNVAVDCARILVSDLEELKKTDMASRALRAFENRHIRRVTLLGRRGHIQASFTMKELRELTKMSNANCIVDVKELDLGINDASKIEMDKQRAQKRMDALLRETANNNNNNYNNNTQSSVILRFLLQPVALNSTTNNNQVVTSVKCERTMLEGPPGKQIAKGTGSFETIPAQMVLRSVGYKGSRIDSSLPFDERRGVVPTDDGGRVVVTAGASSSSSSSQTTIPGLYATGWIRRGPSGIIGTNITDAKEVVDSIVKDFNHNAPPNVNNNNNSTIEEIIQQQKLKVVDWNGVLRLHKKEEEQGKKSNKPREKILHTNEMLKVALG